MSVLPRSPYNGTRRGLVIAIDFGTTFSGVSYAFLEPGEVPKVRTVEGFRGQEDQVNNTKVPSILYYDHLGELRACGAEIGDQKISSQAEEEGWTRVEWLKVLFRPNNQRHIDTPTPDLPHGKAPVDILADYLHYLLNATRDCIQETFGIDQVFWAQLEKEVLYVLSHPNGWGGSQQSHLRNAAIRGSLIPDTESGRSRVHFVSEGEASLHWCVDTGVAGGTLSVGSNIIVADAGGGTVDITAFRVTSEMPLQIEETRPAESHLAGSIFVTKAFQSYASEVLRNSAFGDQERVKRLVDEFEGKSKRVFRDPSCDCSVPFGTMRDHEPNVQVVSGKFVIPGRDVEAFFEGSCAAMSDGIRRQLDPNKATAIFLVGGFAASPWLFSVVQHRLADCQVVIRRAQSHTSKSVAEGAISFFLDHYVTVRVAKFTYGVYSWTFYDERKEEHLRREHLRQREKCSGNVYVGGGFSVHVSKGDIVREAAFHRIPFIVNRGSLIPLEFCEPLVCYHGSVANINWIDEDEDEDKSFRAICMFKATIPAKCAVKQIAANGADYWKFAFFMVVTFGTTAFKCHVEWKERGENEFKRGPVSLVWDEGF